MDTPRSLARPTALSLSRVSDRLSFLYLDMCRVEQDDNGTLAWVETEAHGKRSVYLPVATLCSLLLGPGTTLTQPAAAGLSRNGCAVSFVGSGAVRSYSMFSPLSSSTSLLNAQARASVDPERRMDVAKAMFRMRFPEVMRDEIPDLSIEQLRGMEGARMRAVYRSHAQRHRLSKWRRNKGELGQLDPVNEALNYANTALYGVVHAAICALGMSPGLGVVHEGNPRAFVLDIADLYKAEVTIPLAFAQRKSNDPGRDVMMALRENFRLLRLLPRIVDDIHSLLGINDDEEDWDVNDLHLWGPNGKMVPAGDNWAGR